MWKKKKTGRKISRRENRQPGQNTGKREKGEERSGVRTTKGRLSHLGCFFWGGFFWGRANRALPQGRPLETQERERGKGPFGPHPRALPILKPACTSIKEDESLPFRRRKGEKVFTKRQGFWGEGKKKPGRWTKCVLTFKKNEGTLSRKIGRGGSPRAKGDER